MKEHLIVHYDDVEIEVTAQGEGDLVVLLRPLARLAGPLYATLGEVIRLDL